MKSSFLWLVLCLCLKLCWGENILFFTNNLGSQESLHPLQILAHKLASAGQHKVTIFTLHADEFKSKSNARVRYFYPQSLKELHRNASEAMYSQELESRLLLKYVAAMSPRLTHLESNFKFCESLLQNEEFHSWLGQQPKFDLVLIDKSYDVGNECGYGVAAKFGAKTVSYSATGSLAIWDYVMYGIPPETWWMPTGESFYQGDRMPFLERLSNLYYAVTSYLSYKHYHLGPMEALLKRSFPGVVIKPLKKMVQGDSLYLLNNHYSGDLAKSYPPFVVPIGGMHVGAVKPSRISQEIEAFVKKDEFVYMYFGPQNDFSLVPEDKIKEFVRAVANFPEMKFVWSLNYVPRELPLPKNLLISRDRVTPGVLQTLFVHRGMKAFVSNGDQQNLQYAIHNGVPLLIVPLSQQQEISGKRTRQAGNGVDIDLYDVSNETLTAALRTLLETQRFALKAKSLALASQNRPMSSLDTAFWWLEYALRTDDVSYLKPISMHQPWWTTFSFDVHLTLFFIITVFLSLLSSIIYVCYLSKQVSCDIFPEKKKRN